MKAQKKIDLPLIRAAAEEHLAEIVLPVVDTPVVEETPPVVEVNRAVPNDIASKTYWFGPAKYTPRALHNLSSWERMCKHLMNGGTKGDVLAKELVVNGKHPDKTHFDFVGYLERRGAITTNDPSAE